MYSLYQKGEAVRQFLSIFDLDRVASLKYHALQNIESDDGQDRKLVI